MSSWKLVIGAGPISYFFVNILNRHMICKNKHVEKNKVQMKVCMHDIIFLQKKICFDKCDRTLFFLSCRYIWCFLSKKILWTRNLAEKCVCMYVSSDFFWCSVMVVGEGGELNRIYLILNEQIVKWSEILGDTTHWILKKILAYVQMHAWRIFFIQSVRFPRDLKHHQS